MRAIFFTFSPFYAHFGTNLGSKKHKKSVEILWHRSISYNIYIIYGIKYIYRPAINFAFFLPSKYSPEPLITYISAIKIFVFQRIMQYICYLIRTDESS